MKQLFSFLMVGMAFTALQVATAEAADTALQGGAPGSAAAGHMNQAAQGSTAQGFAGEQHHDGSKGQHKYDGAQGQQHHEGTQGNAAQGFSGEHRGAPGSAAAGR